MIGALNTYSKFYYGYQVTQANRYIDFNDGTEKVALLSLGYYTPTELAVELKKQLEVASLLDFTVTFNRTNRKFTVSSVSNFSLLFITGDNFGQSGYYLFGFSQTDKTGTNTYTSEESSGSVYTPQYILQSYKDPSTNKKAVDGVVNKSASGVKEVIKYGNERFMECEILFITDIQQGVGSVIRSNENGLSEAVAFMEYITEAAKIEFMKDENKIDEFMKISLESTEKDSKGLDYELKEEYDRGFPYYFRTGRLVFKLEG